MRIDGHGYTKCQSESRSLEIHTKFLLVTMSFVKNGNIVEAMKKALTSGFGLGLLAGLTGFAFYFFAFGQTYEGMVRISAVDDPTIVGKVTFQSRFKNRRFLSHTVNLDLMQDTPTTYDGSKIGTSEVVEGFTGSEIQARVGYREEKAGWGYVVSLDLEPTGPFPKETILVLSLLLIFGCTGGMAVLAKAD